MPKKLSFEEVKREFEARGCTLLSTEYQNQSTKLDYICECGHTTTTRFTNFKRGHKCKQCRSAMVSKARKFTYKQVKEMFEIEGCELISKEYEGSSLPLDYKCVCGNISRIALSNFRRGSRCMNCGIEKLRGENNYQWKADRNQDSRNTSEYREWRKSVLERDEYYCQKCGERHWAMTAHHVVNFGEDHGMRYDVDNGISLCRKCHLEFHTQFGFTGNDGEQLLEYLSEVVLDPWYAGEIFD